MLRFTRKLLINGGYISDIQKLIGQRYKHNVNKEKEIIKAEDHNSLALQLYK